MSRYIRIDDFPHGDLKMYLSYDINYYKNKVSSFLQIFEEEKIDYILGVTPLVFNEDDVNFLNKYIINGRVVMHGFTHGFEKEWDKIVDYWPTGGEYSNSSKEEILLKYNKSNDILKNIKRYDNEHFIAPFNCYTQNLIDILDEKGVKFIHTCDKEWNNYNYNLIDHKNITPIISKYNVTYAFADVVLKNIEEDSQITLHWCYDCQRHDWLDNYRKICQKLKEKS